MKVRGKVVKLTLTLCIFFVPAILSASVPQLMNFQGVLTDSDGQPVSDGVHTVVFSVYSSESSGSALWTESRTVATTNGLFTVMLGEIVALPSSLFGNAELWLGIEVDGDGEMKPRHRLTAVPYVYRALNADSAAFAFTVENDAITSGKIADGSILFTDLAQNGAATNQVIKWNGSSWVAATDEAGGGWVDDGSTVRLSSSSDKVGIGVTDPQEKLHVAGDIRLGYGNDVVFGDDSTSLYETGGDLVITANDDLHLQPDDDIYVRTDGGSAWVHFDNSSERLGIGVTTPAEKLHVDGDIRLGSTSDIAFGSDAIRVHAYLGDLLLTSGDDVTISSGDDIHLTPDDDVYIARDGSAAWAHFDNSTERLGLGVTNPPYKLTVNGEVAIASGGVSKYHINYYQGGLNFAETGVSDRRIHISDGGNVGIGTANPGAKLGVNGDLKVSTDLKVNGAFKGNITSSSGTDGAPFPRPAYDSDWQTIAANTASIFTHNIGGDIDDYVIDLLLWDSVFGVHSINYNFTDSGNEEHGAYYAYLSASEILVFRYSDDIYAEKVRVRIWVIE